MLELGQELGLYLGVGGVSLELALAFLDLLN